jgi:hypothetical protein
MSSLRSDPELLVLHALRCSGASSSERIAGIVGPLAELVTESALLDLAAEGLVTHGAGPFGGWRVTDAGRKADAEMIAAELEAAGTRPQVQAAYDDFLPLNGRVLDICGAWQVRSAAVPMVLNDHRDAEYDAAVLDRLTAVDDQGQEICARLAAGLHRFSHYGPRLASALQRATHGELGLVTDTLDSYHTVWFQLHEDLLVTLGIDRHA